MKIATWNVNSLRVRLPHVLQFLQDEQCDVIGLQETKVDGDKFPEDEIRKLGYSCLFSGHKAYNGVAILTRDESVAVSDASFGIPGYPDPQKRLAAATITAQSGASFRFVCGYFPNGQAPGAAKYLYKLEWFCALRSAIEARLRTDPNLILVGDMNVAPTDEDIWDPEGWKGHILVSDAERDAFNSLIALGLTDAFRKAPVTEGDWSWWDYRNNALLRDQGARIDHTLVSDPLVGKIESVKIRRAYRELPQPSDHAPVVLELSL